MYKKIRTYLWIILGIIVVAGAVLITNPFNREQNQMRELRTIGADEKQTNRATNDVQEYVSQEQTLKDVDKSLIEFQTESATQ